MDPADCAIPAVAEALAPFIKSKEEVASIRQSLQSFLADSVDTTEHPLSHLNLANAHTSDRQNNPTSLSGVHGAYWRALTAHEAVQASYDALKKDLEELGGTAPATNKITSTPGTALTQDYLPLIRQREKSRRLKVIESTLVKIEKSGGQTISASLEDAAKKQLSEPPAPPSSQSSSTGALGSVADTHILELKKAIVASKRRLDEHKTRRALDQNFETTALTPQVEVAGLQKALHELTSWMESQLSVIAESNASNETAHTPGSNGTPAAPSQSPVEDLSVLYDDYLAARESLIETVKDAPMQESTSDVELADLSESHHTPNDSVAGQNSAAEELVPHIQALTETRQEEQTLLQSLSFVRSQTVASETAIDVVIRRLADESHLVLPGASRGRDWSKAAMESTTANTKYIDDKTRAGASAVADAKAALEKIQSLPRSLGVLAE